MFEQLGFVGWTPASASVVLGLALGAAFGVLAQRSRFCLRRALTGGPHERSPALGVWLLALAVAIAGTATLSDLGLVDFSAHRFHASALPLGAILLGGLMFGAGMVLARGCASRLTVLAGSGNLRAAIVLIIFAITAHAAMKGVLAPLRLWLVSFTVGLGPVVSLGALPGGAPFWAALAVVALVALGTRSGASVGNLLLGCLIGALIPLGWLVTGYLLADEFNPIALESFAFTSQASDSLFWWVAATAIPPGFGVGILGGVLVGSALAASLSGEFRWRGFAPPSATPASNDTTWRYLLGGALMGAGGVLAGGCTVGAGLSGVSTLSVSAILALVSIAAGARLAAGLTRRASHLAIPLGEKAYTVVRP